MIRPDVIVIGSGFGGAVLSCRLSDRGYRIFVLERVPEDYPREPDDAWIWDEDEPESQNGWTDLRFLDDMWVAQGAGAAAHKSTPTFRSTRSLRVRLAVPDHLFCIS
jgi:choline dehydrogenase-like flavoprotein